MIIQEVRPANDARGVIIAQADTEVTEWEYEVQANGFIMQRDATHEDGVDRFQLIFTRNLTRAQSQAFMTRIAGRYTYNMETETGEFVTALCEFHEDGLLS